MTSLPAQRFWLRDRGRLQAGLWADVVLLDLEAVQDASFERPKQYPAGIPFVMVNGQWVVKDNAFTGTLPGQLARRE
jgi:N-acyl-D-aspartate/D-glutamate deacylase